MSVVVKPRERKKRGKKKKGRKKKTVVRLALSLPRVNKSMDLPHNKHKCDSPLKPNPSYCEHGFLAPPLPYKISPHLTD